MTIGLGSAWTTLPSGQVVHEAYARALARSNRCDPPVGADQLS